METQAHQGAAKRGWGGLSWHAAIHAVTGLGITGQQSDSEQRQVNILNTVFLLVLCPAWLLLSSTYLLAGRWPAGLLMAGGVSALAVLVILHSQGQLSLRRYAQLGLPLVFIIPIAISLCLAGELKSILVTNWSLATPLLAILLDRPAAGRRWFGLLVAINVGLMFLLNEFNPTSDSAALWIKFWQIFNRIGMLAAIYICLDYLHQQHQQAIQQLETFAATVSHELRNPLTSVGLGLAHALRQEDQLSDSQRVALKTALQETHRCQGILGDLLALSRGGPDRQSLSLTSLDPYPLMVAIGEPLRERLGVVLTITSRAPESLRWVLADPGRLRQVLENLIENSAKYSDRQQPVEITIAATAGNQQLQIQVADRGAMLSGQDCLAMFKPFTRLANASGKSGSGLGLTVVRRLVNGMGGTISATPRQGGGLIVTLALVRSGVPATAPQRRS